MKRFVFLGSAVLLLIVLWTGAWFYFANEVKKGVLSLAEGDGVANPKFTCETLGVTGFPFRFDVDCVGATLTQADLTARMDELRGSIRVYSPTHALFFGKSPMTLSDAFTGSQQRIDWTSLEMSARLDGWRIARVSLHADDPTLTDTLIGDVLTTRADSLELHLLDIPERHDPQQGLAALALYAVADGVEAPSVQVADGRTTLEAELTGIPDDVRAFGDADALARWQQAGGRLQVVRLRGDEGQAFYDASGTLGLDSQAMLEGQIKLASRGLIERLEGLFPPEWKALIIGSQAEDGSYSQELNIRGGTVFSGLIPIASVPPLM